MLEGVVKDEGCTQSKKEIADAIKRQYPNINFDAVNESVEEKKSDK